MDKNDWNDAIREWLEEHEEDDVGIPPQRPSLQDSPDGMVVDDDLPREVERAKARAFSIRWGWIWDLCSAVYWFLWEWFTVDVVGGLFRALSVLVIAALLFAIIYNVYVAKTVQPRVLPTLEELMEPPSRGGEE